MTEVTGIHATSIMKWGVIGEEKLSFSGTAIVVDTPYGEANLETTEDFVIARDTGKAVLYAFKKLGLLRIIGIYPGRDLLNSEEMLFCPKDLIDMSRGRGYTFFRGRPYGFIAQNPVFCPTLSMLVDIPVREVLLVREGHWLESEAEIKAFKSMGVDLIIRGASPEVYLSKELEMCFLPLVSRGPVSEETLLRFKDKDKGQECSCQRHMDKARKNGFTEDWIGDVE